MNTNWIIEQVDDEYEVSQGSRRKWRGLSEQAAIRWIKDRSGIKAGEKVYLVELDGYRVDITRGHFSH